jgi:hypothetical protein
MILKVELKKIRKRDIFHCLQSDAKQTMKWVYEGRKGNKILLDYEAYLI